MAKLEITEDQKFSMFFENRIVCEWLSSAQASQFLGVSENALRIMVYRRQIKFHKLGRRLRFHIGDLKSLMAPKGVKK
jgi:excisionase family DNA binding protein